MRYSESSPNAENARKVRTRITPNTDTFYAVYITATNLIMVFLRIRCLAVILILIVIVVSSL